MEAEQGELEQLSSTSGPDARMTRADVRVVRVSPVSAMATALIAELDVDLHARYPGVAFHTLSPDELMAPAFTFVVAEAAGEALGCGALRVREPGVAEIKRMFVRPSARRRGVARAVLRALEARAAELGLPRILIETGAAQPEAIALYLSSGYVPIPRYGEYVDVPTSRCFEKRLGAGE
ncbi:MAG TPA: GNAT family N-acetyltransferase [Vicinamibacterales bacterium]|nr:GNAT family N-acetyltransferase [Vicinamibacterales bacterium]